MKHLYDFMDVFLCNLSLNRMNRADSLPDRVLCESHAYRLYRYMNRPLYKVRPSVMLLSLQDYIK